MEKLITGMHHVAICACGEESFRRAVAFYTEKLGMTLVRTWGEGDKSAAMVDCGGTMLEIFAYADTDEPQPGSVLHFALRCTDVDDAPGVGSVVVIQFSEHVRRMRQAGRE